ncbi:hypothetical protein JCM30566_16950 [Marinitoga arctica]
MWNSIIFIKTINLVSNKKIKNFEKNIIHEMNNSKLIMTNLRSFSNGKN